MRDEKVNIQPGDEIVIVVPEGTDEDEIVIDLDELGIDVENLEGDVNIVIQVEGEGSDDEAAEIEKMIAARAEAKKNKNWAQADAIRDELKAKGIVLEDSPTGTTWKKA